MPHKPGQKEESRARILASAGRGFREHGFGGLGVDGIAKGAGVTSGAFYAHFPSKAAAFREAVAVGMADLREGIVRFRETAGNNSGVRRSSTSISASGAPARSARAAPCRRCRVKWDAATRWCGRSMKPSCGESST